MSPAPGEPPPMPEEHRTTNGSHRTDVDAPSPSAGRTSAPVADDTGAPTELPKKSWFAVLKRAGQQFKQDELTDRAAALTYYAVQAIFPGLLVLVSILGLLGHSTTQTRSSNLGQVAPAGVKPFIQTIITKSEKQESPAGIAACAALL